MIGKVKKLTLAGRRHSSGVVGGPLPELERGTPTTLRRVVLMGSTPKTIHGSLLIISVFLEYWQGARMATLHVDPPARNFVR